MATKKIKRIIAILAIMISASSNYVAKATTNTDIDWNNKLTQGVNINYWIAPGNEYTATIPKAVSKLRYPSGLWNPIVLNPTTVKSNSKMDIYQYSNSGDGTVASASVFRKNSSGSYYNSTSEKDKYDWVYGDLKINDHYMKKYDSDTKASILLHEMLHVYGCKDVSNKNSIMYYSTNTSVKNLTSDANNVLNNKYK